MFKILYHLSYFLLPFFMYFLWVFFSISRFTRKKTFYVSFVSLIMLFLSLIYFRLADTTSINYDYVPPKVIDNQLRDGYFKGNND